MKHTLSVLVENHAGVLSRITGLFARRGFNIESLAVGTTSDPSVSCVTIVVDDRQNQLEQINKQLNKLIDVIKLKDFTPDEIVSRELMLIKVSAGDQNRSKIAELAQLAGAKVADITRSTITLECCDTTDRLENLLELMRPFGLKRVVRTGTIALEKGNEQLTID